MLHHLNFFRRSILILTSPKVENLGYFHSGEVRIVILGSSVMGYYGTPKTQL